MKNNSLKNWAEEVLAHADIKINGDRPWDIKLHNEKLYGRVFSHGSLGLGEAYMDGWWDCDSLDEFFNRIQKADLESKTNLNLTRLFHWGKAWFFNLQTFSGSMRVAREHYDVGNDLYELMLDKRMIYTCAYYKNSGESLDQAEENKLDLIAQKLGLKAGDHVLDIGCGWGGTLKYFAEKYGVKGTGITISKEQLELAKKNCEGLPIEIKFLDYRNLDEKEKYDHIVSVGMFEHVGNKNYRTYMQRAFDSLKPGGNFLLHCIGSNVSRHNIDHWIAEYIFPNSVLPSIAQIGKAIEGIFVMEDWHNFGPDYDKTLMDWYRNFDKNWPQIKDKYGERFYRMWKYYLLCCAGNFRARYTQLWQVVLSKGGHEDKYIAPR